MAKTWSDLLKIKRILSLVRKAKDPAAAYPQLIAHCSEQFPAPLWKRLPDVDVARDVAKAAQWLRKELRARESATGIYLGLDTLNMEGGRGTNVEIGGSDGADPWTTDLEWMSSCAWYGKKHLILGLLEMHRVYGTEEDDLFSFADYVLFLGYSGLVLASALERLPPPVRDGTNGRLFAWGFHDGDIFPMARATGKLVHRHAPPV